MIILDGKKVKKKVLDELHDEVLKLQDKPNLVVIQVGSDEASNIYISQKQKMALLVGYGFKCLKFDSDIKEEELLLEIKKLNENDGVHAILMQLPLPSHIDTNAVLNAIDQKKDVDGLSVINAGKLFHGEDGLVPCTPLGVMKLLEEYNIDVCGKNALVIGRSNLVGKPMAQMLTNAGATVTICHSKTKNLKEYTRLCDILVVAVGKPNLITTDMVNDDAIVIDVGINKHEGKICGDVDFEMVKNKASYITPVPGGIGQMTVAMLGVNVLKAYKMQKGI